MKHFAVAAAIIAITALALYQYQPSHPTLDQTQPIDYLNYNAECTEKLEIECAYDIERTVVMCAKAFETGGVDVIADLKCARDLMSDKKHCWPCICA